MSGQRQDATRSVLGTSTMQGSDWKPSRFFDAWKKKVPTIKEGLVMQYMHYCRGMPADIRRDAIDCILRATMPRVYKSDDNSEAFDAMDNDIDAMREYATRFLDEFWAEYWRDFLARHPVGAEPAAAT